MKTPTRKPRRVPPKPEMARASQTFETPPVKAADPSDASMGWADVGARVKQAGPGATSQPSDPDAWKRAAGKIAIAATIAGSIGFWVSWVW